MKEQDKIILKGIFKNFDNKQYQGRIYEQELFNESFQKLTKKIELKNSIRQLIENNNSKEVLDLIDEEEICNYLRTKKIKRIQDRNGKK